MGRSARAVRERPLIRAVEAAADALVRGLGGAVVPGGEVRGAHRGAEVVVRWLLLEAPSVSHARVVTVFAESGLEIANLVVRPAPSRPAPILGVELVSVRPGEALVVVDASSVDASLMHRAGVDGERGQPGEGATLPLEPVGHALPAWFERWRSPSALVGRARLPQQADALWAVLQARVGNYASQVLHAEDCSDPAAVARITSVHAAYARDHREEDRGLRLLDKLVGEAAARRLMGEVMFPAP